MKTARHTKTRITQTPWDYGYKNDKWSKDELVILSAHKDIIEGEEMQEVICGSFMQGQTRNEANAKYIITCVNNHEKLVEAIKRALNEIKQSTVYMGNARMVLEQALQEIESEAV